MWIYLNNKFVKDEEAVVSVFDHGFLYGDGVYETIRSYGPRIFMRDQHLSRLFRSAEAIGLTIPIPDEEWPDILHEAMIRNEVGTDQRDAYLRITVSRGAGDIGLDPALCSSPTVVVMAKPLVPPASHLYETGVHLIVASTKRNLPSALSPQIKTTNFLNNIQAKREAIAAGAFDSILLNWEQHLTECTISNLFFVRGRHVANACSGMRLTRRHHQNDRDSVGPRSSTSTSKKAAIPLTDLYRPTNAFSRTPAWKSCR